MESVFYEEGALTARSGGGTENSVVVNRFVIGIAAGFDASVFGLHGADYGISKVTGDWSVALTVGNRIECFGTANL